MAKREYIEANKRWLEEKAKEMGYIDIGNVTYIDIKK